MRAARAGDAAGTRVVAVVLNWNGWEDTVRCLAALRALNDPRLTIMVVDNASSDGSCDHIASRHPDVPIVRSTSNRGYAGGNNLGIRWALERGADFVWILNNDTEVDPSALDEVLAAAEDPQVGLVSCRVRDRDGHDHDTGGKGTFGAEEPVACRGCAVGFHACDYLMGAALLVRRATLETVGMIDETYFHYFEERDFVERARRGGWKLVLACRSRVSHGAGRSLSLKSPQSGYYFVRNHVLFFSKFQGRSRLRVLYEQRGVLRTHAALGYVVRTRDGRSVVATVLGAWDALRGRRGSRDLGPAYSRDLTFAARSMIIETQ